MTTPEAEVFRSRKEAHDWLIEQGYAVSVGKFYQDIKRKGFPVLNQDKTISKYQVAVYAKNLETDQQPDPSALSRTEALHRREAAEANIAEMKAERMRRDEDADWLHADVAWSVLAALIGELREVIRRKLHDAQGEITLAAGGDPVRAPEVFEHVDQVVGQAFNEVAGAGLEVRWEETD